MRVAVAVVMLAACGEVGKLPPDAVVEKDLISLAIAPSDGYVRLGKQLKLTANATYDTGVEDVSGKVEWSVTNQDGMATVIAGIVNGADRGRVLVTAKLEEQTDTATIDVHAGVLVAVDFEPPAVMTYSADATGNLAPVHRIAGAATSISGGRGVNIVGDQIAVVDNTGPAIRFFPLEATGNVMPARVLGGMATLLTEPAGLATHGDELFVSNVGATNHILVFAATANGNVAPKRKITNVSPGLQGITVDDEFIYVVEQAPDQKGAVLVFAKTAANDAVPTRTIVGEATKLLMPFGVVVHGEELFVSVWSGEVEGNAILVFPRGANGNAAPTRVISGPKTELSFPTEMRVFENKLYVANYQGKSLLAFPLDANGDVAPVQRIAGPATGIAGAPGIALY